MASNEDLDFALDRGADVPLGTQLAWKLRALMGSGRLDVGQRLPTIRDLAEAADVNVNTVRAVYGRLEAEGAVVSRQGSGTYVAQTQQEAGDRDLEHVVATISEHARSAGLDPREVAARLFAGSSARPAAAAPADDPVSRQELREQIARLEAELARQVVPAPTKAPHPRSVAGRLLSAGELTEVRDTLVARLAEVDLLRDELMSYLSALEKEPEQQETPAKGREKNPSVPRLNLRPARERPA